MTKKETVQTSTSKLNLGSDFNRLMGGFVQIRVCINGVGIKPLSAGRSRCRITTHHVNLYERDLLKVRRLELRSPNRCKRLGMSQGRLPYVIRDVFALMKNRFHSQESFCTSHSFYFYISYGFWLLI